MSGDVVVIYEKQKAVAQIILNRPQVINAFNIQMRDDLYQALLWAKDDPEIRVIVVSGRGSKGFCAGADLTEFGTAPSQTVARQVRWQRDLWGLFASIRKPLIAAVHGFVIGSGVEIMSLCDIRISSQDATFKMPETALSLIPAAGGTQTLARNIGLSRSIEMLLSDVEFDAQRALSMGLVQRVATRESVLAESLMLANMLSNLNQQAVASVKELIYFGADLPITEAIGLERRENAKLFSDSR